MQYVEAPNEAPSGSPKPSVFLAGGITGCSDWQKIVVENLAHVSALTLYNPRRENFPIHDPKAAYEQIKWEYEHLRKADAILFWFPPETLCPIVLYELGAWTVSSKMLFIGTHPDYQRKQDVEIQTKLARPSSEVHTSLETLIDRVAGFSLYFEV